MARQAMVCCVLRLVIAGSHSNPMSDKSCSSSSLIPAIQSNLLHPSSLYLCQIVFISLEGRWSMLITFSTNSYNISIFFSLCEEGHIWYVLGLQIGGEGRAYPCLVLICFQGHSDSSRSFWDEIFPEIKLSKGRTLWHMQKSCIWDAYTTHI